MKTVVELVNKRKTDPPIPRFNLGDQVLICVGREKGKQGAVAQVIQGVIDYVHRYDVQLTDGRRIRCFGFELELLENDYAKIA